MDVVAGSREEESEGGSLCERCTDINLQDLKSNLGYEHQPTWGSLLLGSRNCALCNLLAQSIQRCLNQPNAFQHSLQENSGPVRLVAAGRTVLHQSNGRRVCEGAVDEDVLWKEVALVIGERVNRRDCFFLLNVQVIMVAAHGSAAEEAGVQGIQLNGRFAFTDQNIRSISKLLDNCKNGHSRSQPQCSLGQVEKISKEHFVVYQSSGLPSRLINVEMKDQLKVRLVDVKTREQYLALSYRWGESQRLVTTIDNLALMRKGIEIDRLSSTIQDAILICRALKIRYLWVDALCIIQKGDNGADWSLESQKMGLIYAQAYVTIAAASSDGSEESFLSTPRTPFVEAPFRNVITGPSDGTVLFAMKHHFFEEEFEIATYENSLARRGWVMQERLLSRRTIHFTRRQIYWECGSEFWAENGDARTSMSVDSMKMASTFYRCLFMVANTKNFEKTLAISMLLKVWSELLTEYSELELTYDKDRLPGIRGIARIASLYLPGRYLSGLWEHALSSGLLWVPKKRPMTLCQGKWAPSWSWASKKDAVLSHCGDPIGEPESSCIVLEEVLNFETSSETLVLSGCIQLCNVSLVSEPKSRRGWKDPPAEDDDYRFWPRCLDDSENEINNAVDNICRFDGERGAHAEFLFLVVECSKRYGTRNCRGLLLNRESGCDLDQASYMRVGIGWSSHNVWHDGPTSTISLK